MMFYIKHLNSGKLIYLVIAFSALVTSFNVRKAHSNALSTRKSLLISATESPQSSNTSTPGSVEDLKCAQRSPVDTKYNRIFHPEPIQDQNNQHKNTTIGSQDLKDRRHHAIRIIVDILRIMDVDEHEETIVLLLSLKQFWTDVRIKTPPEYSDECPMIKRLSNDSVRYLPENISSAIWLPDVYLTRVGEIHIPKVLVNSEAVRINNRGDVEYTMFGKFKLSCEMNFRNFPLDVQYCPMYLESWRIRTDEQSLKWDHKNPIGLLSDYSIDQFSLSVVVLRTKEVPYVTGNFARIGFLMIFSRKLPFYLLQVYLPTVLFVIISWLTFFIPPPYAQGRIILTITTLLALTALNSLISKHSPSASYLRGIDVWMQCCFLFVFLAIVDCLVDIRLVFIASQAYKQEKPSFLLPVSVALVENRQVFDDLFGGDGDEQDVSEDGVEATPSIYYDAPEPEISAADLPTRSGKRVSFANNAASSVMRLQPHFVESGPLQLPEAPAGQREELERRAAAFQKLSNIVFLLLFVLFNVCYWSYYLNASHPPEGLVEEISGGFVQPPHHTISEG